ncbi:MAG: hypothetical protein QOE77_1917 [Blastocatellia bacterium]|jgi:hypothetical protein|nr:hypothetical protein [Blastocatellia bacterium]
MPARKAAKKGAAKKSTAKARKAGTGRVLRQNIIDAILERRQWVMYAQPIKDVIAAGNIAEMRQTAALTRRHLADVQKSLGQLDAKIRSSR